MLRTDGRRELLYQYSASAHAGQLLTRDKKRIIPAIITGRISSFFFLLHYTPNSLCWLDGGPPPLQKRCVKSWGSSRKLGGIRTPDPQWLRPCSTYHSVSSCVNGPLFVHVAYIVLKYSYTVHDRDPQQRWRRWQRESHCCVQRQGQCVVVGLPI